MKTLKSNSYQISWAFLVPSVGKITKRDVNVMKKITNCVSNHDNFISISAGSKENIEKKVAALSGKLAKKHFVYFTTDRQVGMIKNEVVDGKIKADFMAVLTNKQKEKFLVI